MKTEELMFVEYKHINKKEIEVKVSIDYNYTINVIWPNTSNYYFWYDNNNTIRFRIKEYCNILLENNEYKRVLTIRKKNWLFENIIYPDYGFDDNISELFIYKKEFSKVDFREMMILCRDNYRCKYGNKELKYFFTFTEKIKISDIKKQLKIK